MTVKKRKWEIEHDLIDAAVQFLKDKELNEWEKEFLQSVESKHLFGNITKAQKFALAKLALKFGFDRKAYT